MDLHGWIDAYLDHLRVERALAKNSLEAYARDLGELARALPEEVSDDVRRIDGARVLDARIPPPPRDREESACAHRGAFGSDEEGVDHAV